VHNFEPDKKAIMLVAGQISGTTFPTRWVAKLARIPCPERLFMLDNGSISWGPVEPSVGLFIRDRHEASFNRSLDATLSET
jgi:hypothetical protein